MQQETDNRTAGDLRRRVLSTPSRYWSIDDLDDPSPAELRELSRIVQAGGLVRVRRGLYWRGALTPFGMSPPHEVATVQALVGVSGSGPAEASAAAELGLSTQVPATAVIATSRRMSAPPDVAVRFVTRSARVGRTVARLRPAEIALLEVLDSWEVTVELTVLEAVARIRDLARSEVIDFARVVRASSTEPALIRARLRALLMSLGEGELASQVTRARTRRLTDEALDLFGDAT